MSHVVDADVQLVPADGQRAFGENWTERIARAVEGPVTGWNVHVNPPAEDPSGNDESCVANTLFVCNTVSRRAFRMSSGSVLVNDENPGPRL